MPPRSKADTMARGQSDKGYKKAPYEKAQKSNRAAVSSDLSSQRSFSKGKVSDELRQAVKDLGGDDEDLELIAGVDEDGELGSIPYADGKAPAGNVDEKTLRMELGRFMKDLDFAGASGEAEMVAADDIEAEESEEDAGEEEGSQDEEEDPGSDAASNDTDDDEVHDDDDNEATQTDAERAAVAKSQVQAGSTPAAPVADAAGSPADPHSTSGKVVPASRSWSSLLPPLPPLTPLPSLPSSKLNALRTRATSLLQSLPALPRASSSSDAAFINQILSSGTHQDKLSALVLLVRDSPMHAVKELGRLRGLMGWKEDGTMGGGGNKDQRIAVVRALTDWWITGGGKEKGKLRYFADQPLLAHPKITDRHLLVYAFEDFLKKWFFNLLQVLEVFSHDTLPFVRMQALNLVFQLLSGNAEQEQNLLRLGVNKLGDNDRSVASKASHHLLQLLQVHPAMKAVVAREVSALVLKRSTGPSQSVSSSHVRFDEPKSKKPEVKAEGTSHARHYGLITLNQITLTKQDQDVAGRMVELYFEVFREVLGDGDKAHEENEEEQIEKVAGKVDKWRGRKKGAKPRGGRKSALENEELVESGEAKLVAAVLTGINRALPYARLDEEIKHVDTLFKITHAGTFNTSIQALQLIFQVSQARQTVSDRFYRTLYESMFDSRLVTSSKQAMYLNLLFKAIKADTNAARMKAVVKRLLQMLGMHQPPFICGALYLLGELFASDPGLRRMLNEPEDDDEERFGDAQEAGMAAAGPSTSSSKAVSKGYDGKKREPQFANAEESCLWELLPFVDHFHPSVCLQATQILLSQPPTGSPDIGLNTLVSFLDRFVYRNPKKTLQPKGASVMQPAAAGDRSGMVVSNKGPRSGEDGFVNSEKFWRKKVEEVPVDQLFFHKFFSSKLAQKSAARKKKGKKVETDEESEEGEDDEPDGVSDESDAAEGGDDGEGEDGDESDLEEDEVWKASMPDAGDDMGLSEEEDEDEDESLDEDAEDADGAAVEDEEEGVSVEPEQESDDEDEDVDGSDDDEDVEDDQAAKDDEEEAVEEEDDSGEPAPLVKPTKRKPTRSSPSPPAASEEDDSDFPDLADEDDDLLSLEDMPDIVLEAAVSDDEGGDLDEGDVKARSKAEGKRKSRGEERKERKKRRREMPLFGSYEEYQAMIEAAGNEGED